MGEFFYPNFAEFVRGALMMLPWMFTCLVASAVFFAVLGGIAHLVGCRKGSVYEMIAGASLLLSAVVTLVFFEVTGIADRTFNANGLRLSGFLVASLFTALLPAIRLVFASSTPPTKVQAVDELPTARYLYWPFPTTVALLIAAIFGAYAGSGGTPRGFVVAFAVNPLLWVSCYAFAKIGQMRCPHCRRGIWSRSVRNAAVGSAVYCGKCQNWSVKPVA